MSKLNSIAQAARLLLPRRVHKLDCLATPERCIHLCIDVQKQFYSKLSSGRFASFPQAINSFAADLRTFGISTLSVASGEDDSYALIQPRDHYAKFGMLDDLLALEKRLGLEERHREADEYLLIKGDDDAFQDEEFANFLRSRGKDTCLISGMNTSSCILDSIKGARAEGLRVIVVYDQLADILVFPYNRKAERTPECHKAFLLKSPLLDTKDVLFCTSEEIMTHLGKNPAAALQQPPDRKDRNQSADFAAPGF